MTQKLPNPPPIGARPPPPPAPPAGPRSLTAELAAALGLPKFTSRAVLTLDVDRPPRLELTVHCFDGAGRPIVEETPGQYGEGVARRIAQVRFMVRLERFEEEKQRG